MLTCSACIQRCIRAICPELGFVHFHSRLSHHHLLKRNSAFTLAHLHRTYATEALSTQDGPLQDTSLHPQLPIPANTRQLRLPGKEPGSFTTSSLQKELRWLRDPLKLADRTLELLRKDDFEKAVAIVRLASKDVECTVSWNHLIDYTMGKGKVTIALKLYNEMKKRAQLPDAYTFTLLFRGFSKYATLPLSVLRALSIYHSMSADNSPVTPSIIHTNAVLKVCALGGDVDGLLGVASKLPSRGRGAPNNLTFTTILNAIRHQAWDEIKGEKMSRQKVEKQERVVRQGRRIWEEIRGRWSKGDLYIDEELVCAVGRLLLLGNDDQDCDDVLSLVEQTMGIPREISRLGTPGREDAMRRMQKAQGSDQSLPDLDSMIPASPPDHDDVPDPATSVFAVLPHGQPQSKALARPSRNTLSLVLDACIRQRLIPAAQDYWGLLTDPSGEYQIVPDAENYHMYLRLLRIQRASKQALNLILDMKQGVLGQKTALQVKTFRIGLSCCVRSKGNKESLQHATQLVSIMYETLPHPDALALSMYLTLAVSQEPRDWRSILSVVRSVELGVRNLRSMLAYGSYDPGHQKEDDVFELVKQVVSAFDIVLDLGNEEMTGQDKAKCKEQKNTAMAWLTRMNNRRRADPKYRVAKKVDEKSRTETNEGSRKSGAAFDSEDENSQVADGTQEVDEIEEAYDLGAGDEPTSRPYVRRRSNYEPGPSEYRQGIRIWKREKRRAKEKVARERRYRTEAEVAKNETR